MTNSEDPNRAALTENEVRHFALEIYRGDQAAVERFLSRPHAMLEDRTPLSVVRENAGGAERVRNLLGGAAYGGPC